MTAYSPLNYALKILEKRSKTVGETKKKMAEKEFSKEEIDATIKKLLANKFLDDEQYARSFIREKISFRHEGKRRIAFELHRKLIPDDIIKKELANIETESEIETASDAAKKWLRIRGKTENIREKLFRHLASKGFDYDTIKEIIDKL
jgi:regulatory protein